MRRTTLVLMAALTACSSGPPPSEVGPWPVTELRRWEVRAGGELRGWLIRVRIEAPGSDQPFFQVQNADRQLLGHIDADGRVYQRVPFSMSERFAGMRPMENALALLYEEDSPLTLVGDGPDPTLGPVEGRPLPAATRKHP